MHRSASSPAPAGNTQRDLALGKDRHEHVGARRLLASRGQRVDDGALGHALKGSVGLGLAIADYQCFQVVVDGALSTRPIPCNSCGRRPQLGTPQVGSGRSTMLPPLCAKEVTM